MKTRSMCVAFAFAGLAVGFLLFSEWPSNNPGRATALFGAAGVALFYLSSWLDSRPVQLYAVYDYWHTSPNFLLARVGILLMVLWVVYAWCRWGWAQLGFSPIIQLGKTSLLVYWVHIQFVYGGLSILPRRQCSVAKATLGLLVIFLAMLALSLVRTNWKRWRKGRAPSPATA